MDSTKHLEHFSYKKGCCISPRKDFTVFGSWGIIFKINIPIVDYTRSLPLGIQIVAKRYDDELLLNFAKFLYDSKLINESKVFTP